MLSKELYINRILNFSGVEIGAALLDRMVDSLLDNLIGKSIHISAVYPNKQLDFRHLIIEKQIKTNDIQNLPLLCRETITDTKQDFIFCLKTITSETGVLYYIIGKYMDNSWLFLEDYFSLIFSSNKEYVNLKITNLDNNISLLY